MKGQHPGPRCSVVVVCGGGDADEAGECEALTGRWGRAADGALSSVKCVCSSDNNTGLPSHRGKHVSALHHFCMCVCCGWLIFFEIYIFLFHVHLSVLFFFVFLPWHLRADFMLLLCNAKPRPVNVLLLNHSVL